MGIILASIPLFFFLIAVELCLAWLGRRPFYRLHDSISDLSAGILSQVAGIATKLLLIGVFSTVFEHARMQLWLPVGLWPDGPMLLSREGWQVDPIAIAGWVAAFVAVDFAYYWFHRLSHEVNVLWAGHIVHHSSEEYNLAVALRQSAVGGLLSWVFYVPLAVLGMSWTQFAVCYALNLVYQFWIHTRAIGRLPAWCEAVLNTPSHHRVHHGVDPEYQDRNYAGVFIVWDRWFGTFTPERQEPVYGLTSPLRSWNPLWAQVHHYVAIARRVWRTPSWRDRWHVVFGSPAWRPASEGGSVMIPAVSRDTFVPFDPAVPKALTQYALAHFAFALPPTLWLLSQASTLPAAHTAAGAFYLALSLTNIGGVMEARRWAFASEQARLGALGIAGVALITTGMAPKQGNGLVVLATASLALLWSQRDAFIASSNEAMDH
ncbi:MAG: hypothetical protein RLZZ621_1630 [Gemmatimonadota bacterium]|jgi:sterol desaturase/sphingolipid hydroxylase (fatty acid hydroxylase superfamily)